MLHAFIAAAFEPAGNHSAPGRGNGCHGWAVALYRDYGPGGGPCGESFILEARASGKFLGPDTANGLDRGMRMASRIASAQTHDVGDGNMEAMAVHLISGDGRSELPTGCREGGDPFSDGIEIHTGEGAYAWRYGCDPVGEAMARARAEVLERRPARHA